MLFNSIQFILFLPLVVLLYYIINQTYRKYLLLIASYYFYMQWNAPYIFLIVISTLIDYILGLELDKGRYNKKLLLSISLVTNLGLLFTFKYFDFFIDQINALTGGNIDYLELILPMGISFYTFQTMSYTIDIYNKKIKPEKDIITFALYVTFFPQLVAGPIERAGNLLSEIKRKVVFSFSNISHGVKLIIWGLFKKIVIADNLSVFADKVFENYESYDEASIFIAIIFFSIQIYCDFSGYTDIAIGSAKMFGVKLNKNFNFPYFSKSLSEFWRRWHISLSTWFRDYLYIPLGGNRVSFAKVVMNVLIVFIVSGFWHGANWTFIIWGAIHGAFVVIEMLFKHKQIIPFKKETIFSSFIKRSYTLIVVLIAWVFFRATTVDDAFGMINELFSGININTVRNVYHLVINDTSVLTNVLLILFLIILEWLMFSRKLHIKLNTSQFMYRYVAYSLIIILILFLGSFGRSEFIYFQF